MQRVGDLPLLLGRKLGEGGLLPHFAPLTFWTVFVDTEVDGSEIEAIEFAEWSSSCWDCEYFSSRTPKHDTGLSFTCSSTAPHLSQVLILSYEMFRKHSAALNATPLLDIIICDEAHRLKNVTGTKTMTALRFGHSKLKKCINSD
jgi:hypothetical protein